MKTVDLLHAVADYQVRGELPTEVAAVHNDSRQVVLGSLFCCIVGYRVDGHDYLADAHKNGAVLALVEHFVDLDIAQVKVTNSRLAMAQIANWFYGQPSQSLFLVGITATNGKTSTSFMVDSIFKRAQLERALIGTVKSEFKGHHDPSVLTTPESLRLQQMFSQMLTVDVTHCTMEVSSSGLELDRVAATDFDVVTLNNISREHIDQHGSFAAYVNHKKKLITNAKASAWAILNLDDDVSRSLIDQTSARVLTYGYADQTGDLFVQSLDLSSGMAEMTVVLRRAIETDFGIIKPTEFHLKLAVAGFNSVMNSLVALAVGIVSGIDRSDIEQGLADYSGVERRFQIVYDRDFKIVDDHFANAGNIDVTFKTVSLMDYRALHVVYAIRGNRGVTTNRQNAERIVAWAKNLGIGHVYATLSKGLVTWKDEVSAEEIAAFEDVLGAAGLSYVIDEQLDAAVARALAMVKTGDIVLLAGCQGMDCGAHVALNQLWLARTADDYDRHYQAILDRVCCEGVMRCAKL